MHGNQSRGGSASAFVIRIEFISKLGYVHVNSGLYPCSSKMNRGGLCKSVSVPGKVEGGPARIFGFDV